MIIRRCGPEWVCKAAGREENRRKLPQLTMNLNPNGKSRVKSIIIAGMLLLASLATSFCQGDSCGDFFHSNQKAKEATEPPRVIQIEGTIVGQIRNGLYLVDVEADCAEKNGFGRSHDDPTLVRGLNDTVIVEHNAVKERVRVVLRGEPQERNDVTISCWVMRDGHYQYESETLPAYKVCAAPTPTPAGSSEPSNTKGNASGQ